MDRSIARNHQIPPEKLAHRRTLMNRAVRDCLVTGFEPLIEGLKLHDEDDRHVLAAAVYACVQEIATSRRRPPQTFGDVLGQLERSGLARSVTALHQGPGTLQSTT